MGKIIESPIEYKYPTVDNWKGYDEEYINSVRNTITSSDPYAGKILYIPHADGYAKYMIKSLKPVVLIHLPVGDAWEAPYVHRMTAKDIRTEIERGEALKKFFVS